MTFKRFHYQCGSYIIVGTPRGKDIHESIFEKANNYLSNNDKFLVTKDLPAERRGDERTRLYSINEGIVLFKDHEIELFHNSISGIERIIDQIGLPKVSRKIIADYNSQIESGIIKIPHETYRGSGHIGGCAWE